MYKLQQLQIHWNDGIDVYMTKVECSDRVLRKFFRIHDWDFIRHIFESVIDESYVEYGNKSISFDKERVFLQVDEESSELDRYEFMNIFHHLFDLLIIGANDDHHGVRYEPWWQEFTETSFQLKYKIEFNSKHCEGIL